MRPTYAELLAAAPWRSMPSCPGRSLWPGLSDRTPTDLVGPDAVVRVFHLATAPDPVHVVVLDDGGLISYGKPDGRFMHTLNTPEGFARKLEQLGISVQS